MRARLCLNMIVKNEARIIERCLTSCAPWISCYVIADTGSTDGTPELIRKFFDERKISGLVVEGVPFEDFSQARNAALDIARKQASNGLDFDYLLLVDADMELMVEDETFRDKLSDPVYLVLQEAGIRYANVRLVASDHPCRYVEPTHEYLSTGVPSPATLDGVWFRDWAEGSSRSEKTERDIRLLTRALEDNPLNARARFYLAQTYKYAERWEEAIEHYRKRIALGGFEEEVWYSRYMLAFCERGRGREEAFVHAALTAYEARPRRAEPLYLLARYYRERGKNALSSMFAHRASTISFPETDILFVEPFVYDYGLREELSIAGFYSDSPRIREDAREACLSLSIDASAPPALRDTAARNSIHYACPLSELAPSAKVAELKGLVAPEPGLSPLNPSLVLEPDGQVLCNVRWVNYTSTQAMARAWPLVVRTVNQIGALDLRTTGLHSPRTIVESEQARSSMPPVTGAAVRGFEDLRLFRWRGELWASATVRDRNPRWLCEIALLKLRKDGASFAIDEVHILNAPDADRHQKNWVPIVRTETDGGESLLFVYESEPTTVLLVDPETFETSILSNRAAASRDFRGSSQAIPFAIDSAPGYLYVVHEAFDHVASHRCYTHRFVWMNCEFAVERVSDPFYFVRRTIEFCAGLACVGDKLVLTFGLEDGQAWMATVEKAEALLMLGARS